MSETIRIPDPVYEQITMEAEQRDVSRGAVVETWMEQAEKFKQMEARHR